MDTTTIEVRVDQAEQLHDLKERGDSYKDVLDRLLALVDEKTDDADQEDLDELDDDEALVASLDLPGAGEKLQERREAVLAVLEYLDTAEDTTTPAELREAVYPDHSARYESADSWWKNLGQVALRQLRDRGRVELVDAARGEWQSRSSP